MGKLLWKQFITLSVVLLGNLFFSQVAQAKMREDYMSPESIEDVGTIMTGSYFSRIYNVINSYLVRTVATNDVEFNMKAAEKWYKWELTKSGDAKRPLVQALRQFVGLWRTYESCGSQFYAFSLKNQLATKAYENRAQTHLGPNKRVENVIYQIITNHAGKCQDSYETSYKTRSKLMDQKILYIISIMLNRIIDMRMLGVSNRGEKENSRTKCPDIYHHVIAWIADVDEYPLILEGVRQLAKNHPDIKYLDYIYDKSKGEKYIDSDKYKELIDRYLIIPCEYYVEELDDVFKPAHQDASWYLGKRGIEHIVYYRAWAKYHLCETIISDNENFLNRMLEYSESLE